MKSSGWLSHNRLYVCIIHIYKQTNYSSRFVIFQRFMLGEKEMRILARFLYISYSEINGIILYILYCNKEIALTIIICTSI